MTLALGLTAFHMKESTVSILVLNDIHCGVKRVAGTTILSQVELRSFLMAQFRDCLDKVDAGIHTLLIDGDLMDDFTIDTADLMDVLSTLSNHWLRRGRQLWLKAGNHDDSAKGNRMSHFEFLCEALKLAFPNQVNVIGVGGYAPSDGYAIIASNVIAVAHHCDQSAFSTKLHEVAGIVQPGTFVFLHANYDNKFAAKSDHSLNVPPDVADMFIERGATLVFSHEHQARTAKDGKVFVMGNQWPTSVADCLGNDAKFAHVICGDGTIQRFETWNRKGEYGLLLADWRELGQLADYKGFIKVIGSAEASEASTVVSTIARFRAKSKAFVVSNAVVVDGIASVDESAEVDTSATSFDLLSFVKGVLTDKQYDMFIKLKGAHDAR